MEDHRNRYQRAENKQHYLSHDIQTKRICKNYKFHGNQFMDKIKSSKYYSVILDCTPDISHIEQ